MANLSSVVETLDLVTAELSQEKDKGIDNQMRDIVQNGRTTVWSLVGWRDAVASGNGSSHRPIVFWVCAVCVLR